MTHKNTELAGGPHWPGSNLEQFGLGMEGSGVTAGARMADKGGLHWHGVEAGKSRVPVHLDGAASDW